MKLVVIESPYAGNVERNLAYARLCLKHSLDRGEAPIASHLLYTQVLQDAIHQERSLGIAAGFAWGMQAEVVAIYEDYGISLGMTQAIQMWKAKGKTIEYRKINP